MALPQVNSAQIDKMLRGVASLVRIPSARYSVEYDEGADVLYLSFAKPQRATDSRLRDDGVIVRSRKGRIVGITVLEASKRRARK